MAKFIPHKSPNNQIWKEELRFFEWESLGVRQKKVWPGLCIGFSSSWDPPAPSTNLHLRPTPKPPWIWCQLKHWFLREASSSVGPTATSDQRNAGTHRNTLLNCSNTSQFALLCSCVCLLQWCLFTFRCKLGIGEPPRWMQYPRQSNGPGKL